MIISFLVAFLLAKKPQNQKTFLMTQVLLEFQAGSPKGIHLEPQTANHLEKWFQLDDSKSL